MPVSPRTTTAPAKGGGAVLTPAPSPSSSDDATPIIIGVVVAAVLAIAAGAGFLLWIRRRSAARYGLPSPMLLKSQSTGDYKSWSSFRQGGSAPEPVAQKLPQPTEVEPMAAPPSPLPVTKMPTFKEKDLPPRSESPDSPFKLEQEKEEQRPSEDDERA